MNAPPPEFDLAAPPANVECEQALIGAILLDNSAMLQVDGLKPADFFEGVHSRIFAAARDLIDQGRQATPTTLRHRFEQDKDLQEIGAGADYLKRLANAAVNTVSARDLAKVIRDLSQKRQVIDVANGMIKAAYDPYAETDGAKQIAAAQEKLDAIADGETEGRAVTFASVLDSVEASLGEIRASGKMTGLSTGLETLDRQLGGLHKSDLIVLAGRPSMGKSALATKIAFSVAGKGQPVAFYTREMGVDQLGQRIVAEESRVSTDRMRRNQFDALDWTEIQQAIKRIRDYPLFLNQRTRTVRSLTTDARRLNRSHGLALIVVDYLQLLVAEKKIENRVAEVSHITNQLKGLAVDMDVPVLALSQLSRAVELRSPAVPMLSDLRESGSIEQDADVVMLLYRQAYYDERAKPRRKTGEGQEAFNERLNGWQADFENVKNVAELIVGKDRHGPIGTCHLFFDPNLTKFADLARGQHV